MAIKIIQIATAGLSDGDFALHGIDAEGNLYEWGSKKIKEGVPAAGIFGKPDFVPRVPPVFVNGWIKCVDEINL